MENKKTMKRQMPLGTNSDKHVTYFFLLGFSRVAFLSNIL